MSVGVGPDLGGNVTAMPVCVNCGGGSASAGGGDPQDYGEYGGPAFMKPFVNPKGKPGAPDPACPVCAGKRCKKPCKGSTCSACGSSCACGSAAQPMAK